MENKKPSAKSENKKSSAESSSNNGRKRQRRKAEVKNKTGEDKDGSDNEFSFLGQSVLKRASNVSDAEDSDGESS